MQKCTEMSERKMIETRNSPPTHEVVPKEDICFQHQFVSSIPIRSLNIYLNQMFCGVIHGLNPMCLVNCENCGAKFISIDGANDLTSGTLFERTFAAYYNTSQLQLSNGTNTHLPDP